MGSFANSLLEHEGLIRLSVFGGMLALMMGLEALLPRRARVQNRVGRWRTNFALSLLNSLLLRYAFPVLAVGAALWTQAQGWDLMPLLELPGWVELIATLLLLDLAIYWQHRIFHITPFFWRFHKVHHSDQDIDTLTAIRFHPVEIIFSMLIKIALVIALGATPEAVILFEIILNATALFNHANLKLPLGVDRVLRLVLVTPDMHRTHHSVIQTETDRNFGFNIPLWDRLFGSYCAGPQAGHLGMDIGLSAYRGPETSQLGWSLVLPFRANSDRTPKEIEEEIHS